MINTEMVINTTLLRGLLIYSEDAPLMRVNLNKEQSGPRGDDLQWVCYQRVDHEIKEFEFSALLNAHKVFSGLVELICSEFEERLGVKGIISPEQFLLIRTRGSLPIHKDPVSATCKFNIGLRNSSTARTSMYDDERRLLYSTRLQDGEVYLLNNHQYHSVESDPDLPADQYRYLASFATRMPFLEVLSKCGLHELVPYATISS